MSDATPAISNAETIASYWRARGLNDVQIAGVLGNAQIESNFNPSAYNSGEGAIGIVQWEGGRRTNLEKYAASHGQSPYSLTTQLNYYYQELTGSYPKAYAALKASTTPRQAALVLASQYEISASSNWTARQNAADSWYSKIKGGQLNIGGAPTMTDTPNTLTPGHLVSQTGKHISDPPLLQYDGKGHWLLPGADIHNQTSKVTKSSYSTSQWQSVMSWLKSYYDNPAAPSSGVTNREIPPTTDGHAKAIIGDLIGAANTIGTQNAGVDIGSVQAGVGPVGNPFSGLVGGLQTILSHITSVAFWERAAVMVLGIILLLFVADALKEG